VLYFVSFLIFPKLAKSGWASLVIYTELVICLQFAWQFIYVDTDISTVTRIWGLEKVDNLWYQLRFPLIILAFTVIQLDMYAVLDRKTAQRQLLNVAAEGATVDDHDKKIEDEFLSLPLIRALIQAADIVQVLAVRFALLGCFLAFSLIALWGTTTIFDVGYLAIFYGYLVLYQMKKLNQLAKLLWPMVCLYPAIIATSCYVYQFSELQKFLGAFLFNTVNHSRRRGR
jgi:hypothetical protein